MKVAVCLYGYPRYFELGFKSLTYFLEDIDCDFYIHSWCEKNTVEEDYKKLYQTIDNLYQPKSFKLERQIDFRTSFDFECNLTEIKKEFIERGIGIPVTLSPMYSIKESCNLMQESNQKYDLVILTRYDVFCSQQLKNYKFENLNEIYSSHCHGNVWDLNKGGEAVDTKMILSNQENMVYFMNIYDYVESYLKNENVKLCHHRLFAHHLKKLNKKFHMIFQDYFSWFYIRENGHLEGDRYQSNISDYPKIFSSK